MQWFKHDTDASADAKLIKLRIKYGMEGYGLYWYCLELIASGVNANNITFELEHDAEIIAHLTGIHYERVQEMMQYMVRLNLFEQDQGVISCLKLAKRLDERWTRSPELKDIIKNVSRLSADNPKTVATRREENRREENRKEEKKRSRAFAPPLPEQVAEYCNQRGKGVDPERWYNFYSAKGWMIGKNKMKDWKAAVRTWEGKDTTKSSYGAQGIAVLDELRRRANGNMDSGRGDCGSNPTIRPQIEELPTGRHDSEDS